MKRRGYILVESLVAMTILSLGMISVSNALGQANYTRALARDRSDARFLLETVIGSVTIQPVIDTGTWAGSFRDHPRFAYEYTVRVASIPEPPMPPARPGQVSEDYELPVSVIGHIRVAVTWTRRGSEYSETFETLFSPERLPEVQMQEFLFRQRTRQGQDGVGFSESDSTFDQQSPLNSGGDYAPF